MRLAPATACLLALASCSGPVPDVAPEAAIAAATGVDDVQFVEVGDSFDAASPGFAPAPPGARLELADALQRAVRSDAAIQAALARVRAALAESRQARTFANPILGFVLRWGHGRPEIEASLTESLLAVLQAPRRARLADSELQRAAAEALTTALDTAARLQQRYVEAQAADRLVPLLAERRDVLAKMVDIAASRARLGEGAQSDVATLTAQRMTLETTLASAQLAQRELRLQLAHCIGEPLAAADWPLADWAAPKDAQNGEAAWLRTALEYRPELAAIGWHLAALGEEQASARWSRWLDASLGVDAQRTPDWAIGPALSLPIPLFDGGGAASDKVAAERAAVAHELTGAVRTVCEEVRRAFAAAEALRRNLRRVHDELIPLQEQRRDQVQRAFELGQLDLSAVLLAEHDLLASRAEALDLARDLCLAWIRLQRAAGGAAASDTAQAPFATNQPASSETLRPQR